MERSIKLLTIIIACYLLQPNKTVAISRPLGEVTAQDEDEDEDEDEKELRIKMKKLESELANVVSVQEDAQRELDKLQLQECKYKEMLNLDEDATAEEIKARINEMLEKEMKSAAEIEAMKKEFKKMENKKRTLNNKLRDLRREQDQTNFDLRQNKMALQKILRKGNAMVILRRVNQILPKGSLPSPSGVKPPVLPPIDHGKRLDAHDQQTSRYCVFCRRVYEAQASHGCRIHYRAFKEDTWTCCSGKTRNSAGCLQLPHFYIEITASNQVLLINGNRFLSLV